MTTNTMTDLETRVFIAIAKATPTKQPAAVLAEIATTHLLVPIDEYELLVTTYREENEG